MDEEMWQEPKGMEEPEELEYGKEELLRRNEEKLLEEKSELEQCKEELEIIEQELRTKEAQKEEAKQELKEAEQELKEAKQELRTKEAQKEDIKQELKEAKQELKEANQELKEATKVLRKKEERIDELRKEFLKLSLVGGSLQQAPGELELHQRIVSDMLEDKSRLVSSLSTIEEEISTTKRKISTIEEEIATIEEEISTIEEKISTIEGKISTIEGEMSVRAQTKSSLLMRMSSLRNSIRLLDDFVAKNRPVSKMPEADLRRCPKRPYLTPSSLILGDLEDRAQKNLPISSQPQPPSGFYVFSKYIQFFENDHDDVHMDDQESEFEIQRKLEMGWKKWKEARPSILFLRRILRSYDANCDLVDWLPPQIDDEVAISGVVSLILGEVFSDTVDVIHQCPCPSAKGVGKSDIAFLYPPRSGSGGGDCAGKQRIVGCVEIKKSHNVKNEGGCSASVLQGLGYLSNFSAVYSKGNFAYFLLSIEKDYMRVCGAWDSAQIGSDDWCYSGGFGELEPDVFPETKWCILDEFRLTDDEECQKRIARVFRALKHIIPALYECKSSRPFGKPIFMRHFHANSGAKFDLMGKDVDIKVFGPNVLLIENRYIMKRYDYHLRPDNVYHRKPNLEIMQSIDSDYLPGMHILKLSRAIQFLVYDYIEGDMLPSRICQIGKLCEDLGKLHEKGYVHGDVRIANFVFSCRKGDDDDDDIYDAHLLDFDYAGKNKEAKYPEGYNTQIPEGRHSNAKGGALLEYEHDRFSMSQCISIICVGWSECRDFCDRIADSRESLKDIGEEIKKIDIYVDCTHLSVSTNATGSPPKEQKGRRMIANV
eukprot:TRINITY_DN259_c1_g1_i6.p1 TRINITY_DN259_c1_g1~~TRINITY_DN259_c1_g1_i6.p1  ORF type:complete len:824 (-),score=233.11 TRINITY_DN259_c1_g1_i6:780-3251(-)